MLIMQKHKGEAVFSAVDIEKAIARRHAEDMWEISAAAGRLMAAAGGGCEDAG